MQSGSDRESFRTGGAFDALADAAAQLEAKLIGRELGDYRITRLIAEGGMSRVFAAERVDGSFERDVAIKVSPVSGLDERLRERFTVEQGVLASLNHPNISQLYDASVTEEGWPYIVMELIDGKRLTDHVDAAGLSVEQRVGLMASVVDAIAYAHSRLVVHRDIKPSNVLVDADGRVRVLDFGIAKLLETDATHLTREQAMTPRYASPEQLLGEPASVGSDIYQLGLLLAEVLTGKPASTDNTLTDAIQRAAEGKSLGLAPEPRHQLPGELVLIIEQCLRREPDERYRDANALREDLEAFLQGYPVAAAGQGRGYRLRKFIGRNLPATAIAVAATFAIVGSTAWYTIEVTKQRDEATRQSELASASLDFLADFFKAADPARAQNAEPTAREILDQGAERLETELGAQPEIRERLYYEIADIYETLSELDKAEELINKSIAIAATYRDKEDRFRLQQQALLGNIYRDQGNSEQALEIQERLVIDSERLLGPDAQETLFAIRDLGVTYEQVGRHNESRKLHEQVYNAFLAMEGRQNESTITTATSLTGIYYALGDHEKSAAMAEEYLEIATKVLGEYHPTTISLLNNLSATVYLTRGTEAAIPYSEDVLRRHEIVYGEGNFTTLRKKAWLGALFTNAGNFDRGSALQLSAIEGMERLQGEEHPRVLIAKSNYMNTLVSMGRLEEAKQVLPALIEAQSRVMGATNQYTFSSKVAYATALIELEDPSASTYASELGQSITSALGTEHHWYKQLQKVLEGGDDKAAL